MNLINRVVIMTLCVFTAYALPNLGEVTLSRENALLKAVIAQLRTALPEQLAANNTQDSCFTAYNNRLNTINSQTVNQTQACYVSADKAQAAYNQSLNQTLVSVNNQSVQLQSRLASCASKNSTEGVFNCYVSTFDQNLANLYNLTVQSQVAASAVSGYAYEVEVVRQGCIGAVLIGNKSNSTAASNDLQICLNNSTGSSNSTNSGNKTMIASTYLYDLV